MISMIPKHPYFLHVQFPMRVVLLDEIDVDQRLGEYCRDEGWQQVA
jgi:hypothetical protein